MFVDNLVGWFREERAEAKQTKYRLHSIATREQEKTGGDWSS